MTQDRCTCTKLRQAKPDGTTHQYNPSCPRHLPPQPDPPLPKCEACGKQMPCNLVILGNEERWYLCPITCMPAFLVDARGWLKSERRHNELIQDALDEDERDDLAPPSPEAIARAIATIEKHGDLHGPCHSCGTVGPLKETEFGREHNPLRGAVCRDGCPTVERKA